MLGDFGADVVKVEGPDSPDPGRGVRIDGYFQSHNRNKRGIVARPQAPRRPRDIAAPRGKRGRVRPEHAAGRDGEARACLRGHARSGTAGIIYASASGYGEQGPARATWPAMDILGQARGGTMMMQGPPDLAPIFSFGGMADQVGAISLSYGILIALWHRRPHGSGPAARRLAARWPGHAAVVQHHGRAFFSGACPCGARARRRADVERLPLQG